MPGQRASIGFPGATLAAMHVLLVEDDLDLGAAMQRALAHSAISSEWVRRASEARQFVEREYDCILLDLNLPEERLIKS